MKKIFCTILLLCCILMNTAASASMILEYDGGVHNYAGSVYALSVNGKRLSDLPLDPIIFNDRALVPLREVFEALGAQVNYSEDKTITVIYGETTVKLAIGSPTATVNGEKKTIPDGAVPRLIARWGSSAKTMVPIRFISENVGLSVDFDGVRGIISVSDGSAPPAQTPPPAAKPSVTLNSVTGRMADDGTVIITVTADKAIASISKAAVTSSGVLYTDVQGAAYSTPNKTELNIGAVTAVRFGQHESSARIAIDTHDMKKHSLSLSEDRKTITFEIAADENAVINPSVTPPPVQSTTPPAAGTDTPAYVPSSEKIVVIDAGHGGSDPGTRGSLMNEQELAAYYAALETTEPILATMEPGSGKTYYEKDIALSVAKKVQSRLQQAGVKVLMTRSGDTYPSLDERPELANSNGAAIFVSIHLNSTTAAVTAAHGVEIYYSEQNNSDELGISSKQMAEEILKDVISATGAKSRGVKSGNLLVNRKCLMPSNLIEIGFMNNPDELSEMITDTYQNKLADGITQGILTAYYKINP